MSGILALAAGRPAAPAGPSRVGALAIGLALARLALLATLAVYLVLYHVYIGIYGAPTSAIFLPMHLLIALSLVFLLNPLGNAHSRYRSLFLSVDALCVVTCTVLAAYYLSIINTWQAMYVGLQPRDYVAGIVLILLILEAVRRTVGWAMIVLAVIFCCHALFANHFPGIFYGPPIKPESLMQTLVVGDAGVFGIPLLVAAQYIVLFLLFGRLLQAAGAGSFFTRIAFAVFGHRVGGPAKAGVVASGLFGMLSGSGVSNVLTTGAFTIPMMRRLGYRAHFAGGVEAAAAVGGSIMPPVMGAVAFMMAEFMGVSYVTVIIAAAIPAFLYYFSIYWTVHFEARKQGLSRLSKDSMPNAWRIMRSNGYLAIPLLMITVLLVMGYSIILVALVTSLGTFLLSFVSRATLLSPSRIGEALEVTARVTCSLSTTCACAGIIIGAMFATGLSFQVTQLILNMVADQLWLILIIAALISLILGTGLTASAVYITMVATVIPILKASGVPEMAAHMFAFYYGVVSDITPPTALAAVAAAGLAGANPMKTMLEASRLGIAAFIVPLIFVFEPALLMIGTPLQIVTATIVASIGLILTTAALAGYFHKPLSAIQRIAFATAAVLLIVNSPLWVDGLGLLIAGAAVLSDRIPGLAPVTVLQIEADAGEQATPANPDMFRRWLDRRIAKEELEAAKEMALEGGGGATKVASAEELGRWLKDERASDQPPPPDIARWSAWAVLAAVTVAIGYMGSLSLHATRPLLWLGLMLVVTIWLVGGLYLTLRGPLQAEARRNEASAVPLG
jgi:TRAP transporter 4TM/12TM fusion protein